MGVFLGVLLLTARLHSGPAAQRPENRAAQVCGLALRRVSNSPAPVESGVLLSFSEGVAPRAVAIKRNRLAWFEPADGLRHDLALRFAGGSKMTAGSAAARGHALAFLCAARGPFEVECLTHQKILFTGFILAGDWVTVCGREGCRFSALPDGDYASTFWTAIGGKQTGPVIHVRGGVLTPSEANGHLLKVEEAD
jgi:hypothetical protein